MSVQDTVLDLLQEVQKAQLDKAGRVLNLQPQEVQAMLRDADPTPKMKYGTWLLKQWLRPEVGAYQRLALYNTGTREYAQGVLARHSRLVQLKRADEFGIAANIFAYTTLGELERALEDVPEAALVSRRQLKRGRVDPLLVPGSELVGEEGDYRVYLATTPDAAMFHGRGTSWCTRARESACHYASERNPLLIAHQRFLRGGRRQGEEAWEPQYQATSDFREVRGAEEGDVSHDELPYEVQVLFGRAAGITGQTSAFVEWVKTSEGAIEDAWNEWIGHKYKEGLIKKFPDLEDEIEDMEGTGRLWQLFSDFAEQYKEITTTWHGDYWDVDVDVEDVVGRTPREEVRFAFDPRRREQTARYQQLELPFRAALPRETLRAEVYGILVA